MPYTYLPSSYSILCSHQALAFSSLGVPNLPSIPFLFPHLHPPLYSTLFFHFPFFSLCLIALMFFLWSTAMSSSSELVWPHVLQEGMSRCGGEGPRGAQRAKYQTNMSPSCLMTSTIQPCRALTVHLHPEGNCDMMAICLFHTAKMSHFIIRRFTHHEAMFFYRKGCRVL